MTPYEVRQGKIRDSRDEFSDEPAMQRLLDIIEALSITVVALKEQLEAHTRKSMILR